MAANVNKCAVLAFNEDDEDRVEFKWGWGEEELGIANQYANRGIEISKSAIGMHT